MNPSDYLLQATNDFFQRLKIPFPPFKNIEELKNHGSSMFVAVYEFMFSTSLEGLERHPGTYSDYENNLRIVFTALSNVIGSDLFEIIDLQAILAGSESEIFKLLRIFKQLKDQEEAMMAKGEEEEEEEDVDVMQQHRDSLLANQQQQEADEEEERKYWETKQRNLTKSEDDYYEEEENLDDRWWARHLPGVNSGKSIDLTDEFANLELLGMRLPVEYSKFQKDLKALRSLAQHRTEAISKNEATAQLQSMKTREESRFKFAYKKLMDESRREFLLSQQRRRALEEIQRRRERYERKVENERIKRISEDLRSEAISRRLRRKHKEDELVKTMFENAFEVEKERIKASRQIEKDEMAKRDLEMIQKFEEMKKNAHDRNELLQEKIREEKRTRMIGQKQRKETLRKLQMELRKDFETKLDKFRVELDRNEEELFLMNAKVVEKAFSILSDDATFLFRLSGLA